MKFKVGDKVRVKKDLDKIKDLNYGYVSDMAKFEGKIVTIKNVLMNGYDIEESCWSFDEKAFEPIYKKLTKQELLDMPVGTKIYTDAEDEDYQEYIKKFNKNFEGKGTTILKEEIKNDLTLADANCGTKIIKIEKPTYETVYEYEKGPKEMTIAEIEKKLKENGYSIKIIKED